MYHRNDSPFDPFSGFNARPQHTPTGAADLAESGLCVAARTRLVLPSGYPRRPSVSVRPAALLSGVLLQCLPRGPSTSWAPPRESSSRGLLPRRPRRPPHARPRWGTGCTASICTCHAPGLPRTLPSSAALPYNKAHDARATYALAGLRADGRAQAVRSGTVGKTAPVGSLGFAAARGRLTTLRSG